MLKYFISILILLCFFNGWAQDEPIDLQPQDTIVQKQTYGLRVGIDLSRIIISQTTDDYTGIELVGDFRLKENSI